MERVTTTEEAAAAFTTLAEAEGDAAPLTARICRAIAERPDVADLLLVPPAGQRLATLVLAALHHTVMADPTTPLARWYPTVGGDPGAPGDVGAAVDTTVRDHRSDLERILTTRTVQTNEVNRSVAWALGLGELVRAGRIGRRSLALVELGASAGLNLRPDMARVDLVDRCSGVTRSTGDPGAALRLSSDLRSDWPDLPARLPRPALRRGLDRAPVDLADEDAVRWLAACVWPEQAHRQERLASAVALARRAPAEVRLGDVVRDLHAVLDPVPPDQDLVVTISWTLVYMAREDRTALSEALVAVARGRPDGRLHVLTLEAPTVVPWIEPPPVAPDASDALRHASVLGLSTATADGHAARALARAQAHLAWVERLPAR